MQGRRLWKKRSAAQLLSWGSGNDEPAAAVDGAVVDDSL